MTTVTCGARLVTSPEPTGDSIAISMFVREEPALTAADEATREIVNSAIFFGTVHLSADAAEILAAKIGGITTRETPDYLEVRCITSPSRFRDAIYLLSEAIKNAQFDDASIEKARANVLRMRDDRTSDPFLTTYDSACFGLTRITRGRIQADSVQLRHVSVAAATAYFRTHFVPARTVFSVAGAFEADKFGRSLDNNLFDFDRKAEPLPQPASFDPSAANRLSESPASSSGPGVCYAIVATEAPSVNDSVYPAFCVLSTLLGGGHASRMFHTLRDDAGIGYSVGTAFRAEDGDPMTAYVEWDAAGRNARPGVEVLSKIELLLNALADPRAKITDAETIRARNFAAGQYVIRHERLAERAFLPGWYETMGAGYQLDAALDSRLKAVSTEDLHRVAAKYFALRASALRTIR